MIAQQLWDGTFSTEAVATAGLARLDQLHAEALATIADIAAHWDRPADERPADDAEDATVSDPETRSVADDDEFADEDDEELRVLPLAELPPLPPLLLRPRAANVTARVAADERVLAAS